MLNHSIHTSCPASRGKLLLMGDPETPTRSSILGRSPLRFPEPMTDHAGALIVCHPDDEERIRDGLAREQEAPKTWRDLQRLHRYLDRDRDDEG